MLLLEETRRTNTKPNPASSNSALITTSLPPSPRPPLPNTQTQNPNPSQPQYNRGGGRNQRRGRGRGRFSGNRFYQQPWSTPTWQNPPPWAPLQYPGWQQNPSAGILGPRPSHGSSGAPSAYEPPSSSPPAWDPSAMHVRLPFSEFVSFSSTPFHIIHCDLWTSPLCSISGFKYYLVLLDNFSHFTWVYPLKTKSETFSKFKEFYNLILTQFKVKIQHLQCDNGKEFDNSSFHSFFRDNGLQFRFSCPHTSQQNGKAERILRTINNSVRTLLFQAHLPPKFWVEALNTAVHLINRLPSKPIHNKTPYEVLYGRPPVYHHLRVFGCACYPNLSSTTPDKLSPRSTKCVFLGYPSNHSGYQCMDLATNKIIILRHVVFDESYFPFQHDLSPPSPAQYDFLNYITLHQSYFPSQHFPPTTNHSSSPTSIHNPTTPPSSPPSTSAPAAQLSAAPQHFSSDQSPSTTSPEHSPQPAPQASPTPQHHMMTRSRMGIHKPKQIFNLSVTQPTADIPKSYKSALQNPLWLEAMTEEYNALINNCTWDLVPPPVSTNILAYLLVYVDDIILTASSQLLIHSITTALHNEFKMTDLGPLHYFLGVAVHRNSAGMVLSQEKYAHEILEKAGMANCKPCTTPVELSGKLSGHIGLLFPDPTLYRSLADEGLGMSKAKIKNSDFMDIHGELLHMVTRAGKIESRVGQLEDEIGALTEEVKELGLSTERRGTVESQAESANRGNSPVVELEKSPVENRVPWVGEIPSSSCVDDGYWEHARLSSRCLTTRIC
ncbi:hypothetical protein V2J09_004354 [Rumex salicifolius]